MSARPGSKLKVLVIDDQWGRDTFRQAALEELGEPLGVEFSFCTGQVKSGRKLSNDVAPAIAAVQGDRQASDWALVLVDMQFVSGTVDANGVPAGMPGDDGFGAAIETGLLERFPDLPVVRFTTLHQKDLPTGSAPPFVSKLGLTTKGLALALVEHGRMDAATRRSLLGVPPDTTFESPAMFSVYLRASQHAQSDTPILILGETGTGKEHLARFIHSVSSRGGAPFVAVNVSAIAPDLFEAEMFGSTKGSFTGSNGDRVGLVEASRGGTLFLDELGDMSPSHQAKVLRFIQTGEYRPVGSARDIAGHCSVVAATSRPLDAWAQEGSEQFRVDLRHRFSRVVRIPPLHSRREDVRPLVAHTLSKAMRDQGKVGIEIGAVALSAICKARFAGNVRDLVNGITNAVESAQNNSLLSIAQFPSVWFAPDSSMPLASDPLGLGANRDAVCIEDLVKIMRAFAFDPFDPALKGSLPILESAWTSVRRQLALSALERLRHPSGKLVLFPAMQLLLGDKKLTPVQGARLVNSLLDRKHDLTIEHSELNQLIASAIARRDY